MQAVRPVRRWQEAAHLTPQISSMERRMGGRGSSSASSTATPAATLLPPPPTACLLRPGFCFGGAMPHQRRQLAFLQTAAPSARACTEAKASGTNCHWPEEFSGAGQAGQTQGPSGMPRRSTCVLFPLPTLPTAKSTFLAGARRSTFILIECMSGEITYLVLPTAKHFRFEIPSDSVRPI